MKISLLSCRLIPCLIAVAFLLPRLESRAVEEAKSASGLGIEGLGKNLKLKYGTLSIGRNMKTQLITSLTALKQVHLTTDLIDLKCDSLFYYPAKNQLIALGYPVEILKEGMNARCQRLEVFLETKEGMKFILTGKPEVLSKTQGNVKGDIIEIIQGKETFHMFVDASKSAEAGELSMGGDPAKPDKPAEIVLPLTNTGLRSKETESPRTTDTKGQDKKRTDDTKVKVQGTNTSKPPPAPTPKPKPKRPPRISE